MKYFLRFLIPSMLVCCAVAQTTMPSPEEIAVRAQYATAATAIGEIVMQNSLANGILPSNVNLAAAGVPRFIVSGFSVGNANDLPNNLDPLVTPKLSNTAFIGLTSSGEAAWQVTTNAEAPHLVSTIKPDGPIYTRYARYDINVLLQGRSQNYMALALIGRDAAGEPAIHIFDSIAPFVDPPASIAAGFTIPRPECPPWGCPNPGGGDGGTGESYSMDIANGGDGYSLDFSYQPSLDGQGRMVAGLPSQWIDPILADPLAANSLNLTNPDCAPCVQDQQNICAATFNQTKTVYLASAGTVLAGCVVATVATGGTAAAICAPTTFLTSLGAYFIVRAAQHTENACMTNVKYSCASSCK